LIPSARALQALQRHDQARFIEWRKIAFAAQRNLAPIRHPIELQPRQLFRVKEGVHGVTAERPMLQAGNDIESGNCQETYDRQTREPNGVHGYRQLGYQVLNLEAMARSIAAQGSRPSLLRPAVCWDLF
jgi:hypothetical protein